MPKEVDPQTQAKRKQAKWKQAIETLLSPENPSQWNSNSENGVTAWTRDNGDFIVTVSTGSMMTTPSPDPGLEILGLKTIQDIEDAIRFFKGKKLKSFAGYHQYSLSPDAIEAFSNLQESNTSQPDNN